jgi:hypothetical protein
VIAFTEVVLWRVQYFKSRNITNPEQGGSNMPAPSRSERPIYNPHPYNGPNYQGFVFVLVSSTPGKANHILTIAQQFYEHYLPLAYITGYWRGDSPQSQKLLEGLITGNGDGIQVSWTTPNGTNVLTGTLTYEPGSFTRPPIGFIWPHALLDGEVVAYDAQGNVIPGAGPGHVSGTGTRPLVALP